MSSIKKRRVTAGDLIPPTNWNLKHFLKEYKQAEGISKLILIGQMRDYVRTAPTNTLLGEIERIHEKEELNVLLGVGLRGVLYYAVVLKKVETGNI